MGLAENSSSNKMKVKMEKIEEGECFYPSSGSTTNRKCKIGQQKIWFCSLHDGTLVLQYREL